MNYEQAYHQLINVVMDDIDNVSVEAAKKVEAIHSSITDNPTSNEQGITAAEWKQMTYTERVELKKNDPEAYESAIKSDFKEVEA